MSLMPYENEREATYEELQQLCYQQHLENEELRKALTPPTVDEVCKALSEFMEEEVVYSKPYFMADVLVVCGLNYAGNVYFNEEFPIKAALMVCGFYEAQEGEKK